MKSAFKGIAIAVVVLAALEGSLRLAGMGGASVKLLATQQLAKHGAAQDRVAVINLGVPGYSRPVEVEPRKRSRRRNQQPPKA